MNCLSGLGCSLLLVHICPGFHLMRCMQGSNLPLDLYDAEEPAITEHQHLPDTEALAEDFKACLQVGACHPSAACATMCVRFRSACRSQIIALLPDAPPQACDTPRTGQAWLHMHLAGNDIRAEPTQVLLATYFVHLCQQCDCWQSGSLRVV